MSGRVVILAGAFRTATALEAMLVAGSCEVAIATRIDDALALCERNRGDVVLVDGGMAGVPEACRRLRGALGRRPILAVTPKDAPLARLAALDAGADELLSWPAVPAELLARIACLGDLKTLRDAADARRALRGETDSPIAARPRLLVLDPQERPRLRLAELLAGEGEVSASADPTEGLVGAAEGRFDIAWVSLAWAEWDGLRLARHLRLVDSTGGLRVLGLGPPEGASLRVLVESGIDDVLGRPADRCEALARTRVAAARRELTLLSQQAEPRAPVVPMPRSTFGGRRRPPDRYAA